jgi:hypothetical protein
VVVQAVSIIDRAIAKSYHDKTEEGGCEPVLVTDVTSTGYFLPFEKTHRQRAGEGGRRSIGERVVGRSLVGLCGVVCRAKWAVRAHLPKYFRK